MLATGHPQYDPHLDFLRPQSNTFVCIASVGTKRSPHSRVGATGTPRNALGEFGANGGGWQPTPEPALRNLNMRRTVGPPLSVNPQCPPPPALQVEIPPPPPSTHTNALPRADVDQQLLVTQKDITLDTSDATRDATSLCGAPPQQPAPPMAPWTHSLVRHRTPVGPRLVLWERDGTWSLPPPGTARVF